MAPETAVQFAVKSSQPIFVAAFTGGAIGGTQAAGHETMFHAEFTYASKQLVVVLNIKRPAAGETILFLSVVVILGIRKPLVVLLTSNIAELSGFEPVLLILTPCWADSFALLINKKSAAAVINVNLFIPVFSYHM